MSPYAYPFMGIDPNELLLMQIIFTCGEIMIASEALAAYIFPTLIAIARGVPDQRRIITINLALGWTIVAWGYALFHATTEPSATPPPLPRRDAGSSVSNEATGSEAHR